MRIAHVITRMIIGGAQENTLLCCRELARRYGDQVLLVTGPALGPEGDLLAQPGGAGVPVRLIPSLRRPIRPVRDAAAYFALRRTLREFRPDVVHTHSAKGGFLGRLAAAAVGAPVIVHTVHGAPFHEYQSVWARRLYQRCERLAARKCHALVCVADAMAERLVRAGVAPREQCTTIYSGMDVRPLLEAHRLRDAVRRRLGYQPHHVVVAKVARLFHLKGHDDLIHAAAQAARQRPELQVLLVGDGVLRRRLERRVAAAGLAGRVRFAGLVPPDQIPGLLAAADLVAHCSLREGLARVLPQALLVGRPVISYDVDGAREVVVTGRTGVLLPPRDVAGLARAVVQLADSPAQRRRMGQAGRELAQRFCHRRMTEQIRALYQRLRRQKTLSRHA